MGQIRLRPDRTARTARLSASIIVWLACTMGCDGNRATGPAFEDVLHLGPETALLYFYRPPVPDGDQAPQWVYAFDQIIRLDDGGYSFHAVPPGRYLISLRSQSDPTADWYDLAAGRATFLKWNRAKAGGQPTLIPVDERRAIEELPQCRLMQHDPSGRP
ncbi:protein of unknown function [Nitrospira japonica]|uniref:DUF2846 domain-containing protein n=1 Tax=Nitrospira japonica TaxID=1325564 RepID=A0A1W1IA02_9BACT|nr:hypothetical protein [Nitrospira japonica]SLM49878.1 protein of unknown function [Nitrospira japonica]